MMKNNNITKAVKAFKEMMEARAKAEEARTKADAAQAQLEKNPAAMFNVKRLANIKGIIMDTPNQIPGEIMTRETQINVRHKSWEPMETAPRDGSITLITFTPKEQWKFSQQPLFLANWDIEEQIWSCCGFDPNMGSHAIQLHFTAQQLEECGGKWWAEVETLLGIPEKERTPAEEKAAEFIKAVAEEGKEAFALEEVIRIMARFFPEYITYKEEE